MRHQIALAVALLGISSMLCLELMKKVGRRLEEQQKKKERRVTAHPGGPASGVSVCPFLTGGDGR